MIRPSPFFLRSLHLPQPIQPFDVLIVNPSLFNEFLERFEVLLIHRSLKPCTFAFAVEQSTAKRTVIAQRTQPTSLERALTIGFWWGSGEAARVDDVRPLGAGHEHTMAIIIKMAAKSSRDARRPLLINFVCQLVVEMLDFRNEILVGRQFIQLIRIQRRAYQSFFFRIVSISS